MKKKSEKPTDPPRSRKSKPAVAKRKPKKSKPPLESATQSRPDQSDEQQASMEAMQKASANILKLIRAGFTIDLRD